MRVCVVGAGAREHALALVLARTADVVITPGNAGTKGLSSQGHELSSTATRPEEVEADLFVIGPEVPLVDGLADRLRARGQLVFGPTEAGAMLEGSKAFMKELAQAAGVPTARFRAVESLDDAKDFLRTLPGLYVIKTDGLAAGKGVLVTDDFDEAVTDASRKLSGDSFGDAGRRIVIEEGLAGTEVSLLVLCDGKNVMALPAARDYKRIGDGDVGPNTGGMGAFCSPEVASLASVDEIMDKIVAPTVAELRRRDIEYRGVLYAGCMLTAEGPKLIEYNVRFGDPEAEVVLPRIDGDVTELLASVARGQLVGEPKIAKDVAVCVVLAAAGYPELPQTGEVIEGLEAASALSDVMVFHAATRLGTGGKVETAGGRVLTVSALGADLGAARKRAYDAISHISFRGMQYRRDIGDLVEHNVGGRDSNVFANSNRIGKVSL